MLILHYPMSVPKLRVSILGSLRSICQGRSRHIRDLLGISSDCEEALNCNGERKGKRAGK